MSQSVEMKVLRSTGAWYDLLDPETNKMYQGRLRGKIKLKGIKLSNPIAVGDKVMAEIEELEDDKAIITEIVERDNYVMRASTHKTAHGHIIAANIDQVVILATLVMPRTSNGFIDRILVSTESFSIPTKVVFNKTDLLTEEGIAYMEEMCEIYNDLGYESFGVSLLEDESIERIRDLLDGKTTLVAGHSGVGKSTMLNALDAEVNQKTSEVSTFANKGVHTTTFAEMFNLGNDTYLIDTPGIKEFGIFGLEDYKLDYFFPEMRKLMGECKFHDCTHTHEPKCAVIAAVEEGLIAPSRYHSYLSILESEDNRR